MAILDFITQDQLDDLDDDPRVAFMGLVQHAQRNLAEQLGRLDPQNEAEYEARDELRHRFMNVVIASAKRYEIEPFISMQVPRYTDFRRNFDFREFQADLDHYVTQLVLDNSMRSRRDSIAILQKSKDSIRSYVVALRQCIEQANMTEPKREALLKRLDQFETELEKRRVNVLAVAHVALELFAVPGAAWASVEVANKLISNIMQTVAEARIAEQESRQLSAVATPKALLPPRDEKSSSGFGRQAPLERSRSNAIDDDIPF